MYAERAVAIHDLSRDLRRRMEVISAVGTIADRMAIIDIAVEAINKIFYFFAVDDDFATCIETKINTPYRGLRPNPSYITRLYYRLMAVVRQVEKKAATWVRKCRK